MLQLTKSISRFLAQTRKRNDISNRSEFLQSISEKRRNAASSQGGAGAGDVDMVSEEAESSRSSCARVDAKSQNREVQMKYDIAKNEDGPLKRTIKREELAEQQSRQRPDADHPFVKLEDTIHNNPGMLERFTNFESHLAVRFG